MKVEKSDSEPHNIFSELARGGQKKFTKTRIISEGGKKIFRANLPNTDSLAPPPGKIVNCINYTYTAFNIGLRIFFPHSKYASRNSLISKVSCKKCRFFAKNGIINDKKDTVIIIPNIT